MSSDPGNAESLAVSRNVYRPGALNVAVVDALLASAKTTAPGPSSFSQSRVSCPPAGRPSSVTEPFNVADDGNVIVWSTPADTVGATFVGTVNPA
ncbi:MAG: hypothetical protein ABL961_18590, partial [Vicinamibacterales bacterium]